MRIRAILFWAVIGAVLAGIPVESGLAREWDEMETGPALQFNTRFFPPFSYPAPGGVGGPVAEIVERVCDEARINCAISLINWDIAQNEVESGRADGCFPVGWNAAMAEWLHYTGPVLAAEYGFFSRTHSPSDYQYVSDLEGLTIAVSGPSAASASLERIKMQLKGKLNILLYPAAEALFWRLAADPDVDAVYADKDAGVAIIQRLSLGEHIRYLGRHRMANYYIGISKRADSDVFEKFHHAFGQLERRGVVDRILAEHGIGEVPPRQSACSLTLRAAARTLSAQDVARLRRRFLASHGIPAKVSSSQCGYPQRFQQLGDGMFMDNAAGILWHNGRRLRKMLWEEAAAYIEKINRIKFGGYDNWRLPTAEELCSIIPSGPHGETDFGNRLRKSSILPFWSADQEADPNHHIWVADLMAGMLAPASRHEFFSVIAVRSCYDPHPPESPAASRPATSPSGETH